MSFLKRLRNAFNIFMKRDEPYQDYGPSSGGRSSYRPIRPSGSAKATLSPILTRIAIDVSIQRFRHILIDENDSFIEEIPSELNHCLDLAPNIDQTPSSFIHDAVWSLLDEGVVAIVPIETTIKKAGSPGFDIFSLRVARIVEWFPRHVRVSVYNDDPKVGQTQDLILPKSEVAIVENPLYSTMNEPNSTMRRLLEKLTLLDMADALTASGKLDLIIQLPFLVKTEARQKQAEKRRTDLEDQLVNSRYGIAYTDATEKVIQLNRSVENKLLEQVQSLSEALFGQLGLTQSLLSGTGTEGELLNYFHRTVGPISLSLSEAMSKSFLPRPTIERREKIWYFRDPFIFATTEGLAKVADTFTRNEILSPNDMRSVIGFRPSKDPKSDELRNRNINAGNDQKEGAVNDQTD